MRTWATTWGATVVTTRGNKTSSRRLQAGASLFSGILGLILILLAAPSAVVESVLALAAPGVEAISRRADGQATPADALTRRLIQFSAGSNVTRQAHLMAARIGSADLRVETDASHAKMDSVLKSYERALSTAPLDSWTWYRYAYHLYGRGRLITAAKAWGLSVYSGAFDYHLIYPRLEAGLALWPYMDVPSRDAFGIQAYGHWRWEPSGLAGNLHRFGAGYIGIVALSPWPEAQADIRHRLAKLTAERFSR